MFFSLKSAHNKQHQQIVHFSRNPSCLLLPLKVTDSPFHWSCSWPCAGVTQSTGVITRLPSTYGVCMYVFTSAAFPQMTSTNTASEAVWLWNAFTAQMSGELKYSRNMKMPCSHWNLFYLNTHLRNELRKPEFYKLLSGASKRWLWFYPLHKRGVSLLTHKTVSWWFNLPLLV